MHINKFIPGTIIKTLKLHENNNQYLNQNLL